MLRSYIPTTLLLLFGAFAVSAQPVQTPHVEAALIPEVASIQPGQPFWTALHLKIVDEWHTYWRNPGDAGLETQITWELPDGFSADEIEWPFPQRIETPPLVTFGYEGEVTLLTKVQPPASLQPGSTIEIKARADWLVCKEACIPEHGEFRLRLPVETAARLDENRRALFAKARNKLPGSQPDWQFRASANDSLLFLDVDSPQPLNAKATSLVFFPAEYAVVKYWPRPIIEKGDHGVRLVMQRAGATVPDRLHGVLVYMDADTTALQVDIPIVPPQKSD